MLENIKAAFNKVKGGVGHFFKKCKENRILYPLYIGYLGAASSFASLWISVFYVNRRVIQPFERGIFLEVMSKAEIVATGCVPDPVTNYVSIPTSSLMYAQNVFCPTAEIAASTIPQVDALLDAYKPMLNPLRFLTVEMIGGGIVLGVIGASIHAQFRDAPVAQLPIVSLVAAAPPLPPVPPSTTTEETDDNLATDVQVDSTVITMPTAPQYKM